MIRAVYLAALVTMAVTALRTNLLVDDAAYRAGIPWLLGAVTSGLTAIVLGRKISHSVPSRG